MTGADARALSRAATGLSAAPVRIIHLGLGAFHRAHEAWYTAHAPDAAGWGIAAFTGHSVEAAQAAARQDGLYTLIVRAPDGDRVEVVPSIIAVHAGHEVSALTGYAARPEVAVISLTVTEAGYRLTGDGDPHPGDAELRTDIRAMAASGAAGAAPTTALCRLVTALDARRLAGAGPIAVVPCDNVPNNGPWLRRGVLAVAARVDEELHTWIADTVSFVATSVDRITPRATAADAEVARAVGWIDATPVVTEPFSDWALCGDFPAGRPDWAGAGARFVDDIEPDERRKLWLLNGAHSLLAAAGINRGLSTIAEAAAMPEVWSQVERFWAEAVPHLEGAIETVDYREQLRERFANPRIVHSLAQVASDASTKLRLREVVVAKHEHAAGRSARACAEAIGEWIVSVGTASGATDTRAGDIAAARAGEDPVRALVGLLDADLAANRAFVTLVRARVDLLEHRT